MRKLISKFFARPLQTNITPVQKPELKLHSSVVPESFIKNFKTWDEGLYPNKEIFKA